MGGQIRRLLGATILASAFALTSTAQAQHPSELTPRDKGELFVQHLVKVLRLDPAKYQAMVLEYEIGNALVEGKVLEPEVLAENFVRNALRELHPEYARALDLAEAGRLDEAEKTIAPLLRSADPYTGAHARLLQAEIEFRRGRYDKAIEIAEEIARKDRMRLIDDYRACEIIARSFEELDRPVLAYAQYWLLLVDYHDLPREVAARAKQRIVALQEKAGRPLTTVAGWMNHVEKLLRQEVTAEDPTQKKEREIVSALDKLIELQEAKERNTCPNCGSSDGSCRGGCKNGRPSGSRSKNPAEVSMLPNAGKGPVELRGVSRGNTGSQWGLLKERDAARALQSFRGKLPPRYERLLREYYKALSREER